MALDVLEDTVAETTSPLDVAGLEGETEALSRCIRLVHRHVAPPHATVVPQVVVKVIVVDTKRDLCLLRGHFLEIYSETNRAGFRLQKVSAFVAEPPSRYLRGLVFWIDAGGSRSVQKKRQDLVKNPGLLERVVGAVLGNSAQSLAGELHAKVATLATVELGHPDTLLLEVGVNSAVHHFGDVTADTTLLLGKTGTMDATALVRHGKRDIADTGHKMF